LSAFPFAFMALFTLLDPSSMSYLYNTLIGQFVILTVGVIVYFSALWCRRILNMEM
jgi:Flp pilus assembly protein TadB